MEKIKEKGITLISLVVTIIVLIILAGTTIQIFKDSNIIKNAEDAKEKDKIMQEKEKENLKELEELIKNPYKEEIVPTANANELLGKVYPKGTIYETTEISTSEEMAEQFGGTWKKIAQGKILTELVDIMEPQLNITIIYMIMEHGIVLIPQILQKTL